MSTEDSDRLTDPMEYDIMRDLATEVGGRYIAMEDAAEARGDTARAKELEQTRWALDDEIHAMNGLSRSAVAAQTKRLRALLTELRAQPLG